MKRINRLKTLSVVLLMALGVSACSGAAPEANKAGEAAPQAAGGKEVKISFLNSKGEIQQQLEDAAKAFKQDHPEITLEVIQVPAGQSPFERASVLYAGGNPTTLAMVDPADVEKFKDRALDLSGEKWKADAVPNSLESATIDGKLLAFPFAVEGFGFIYNKQVLDKAVGGTFDPATVKTTADLENLFKKIEASGKAPLIVSPMDWSLGAHYLSVLYTAQSKDSQVPAFIKSLKEGNANLAANRVFNGLMDTFDVMMKYNMDKESPLTGTYEKGPEVLGKGEVGLWFMGNWAWPQIKGFDTANGQYGFLPVPISNNAGDYGNSEISATVTKRVIIDKEKSTPEQQEAAKKFLEWLVYEKNGQDFLVNKASIIPAFKNITLEPQDPLAKSIKDYIAKGKTMDAMNTLPADHWSKNGASMQKYLAKQADRATLAQEIENYWKSVK